jgi:hypothetical protein
MVDELVVAPLLVLAALIVLFALVIGAFVARRLLLGRRTDSFDCSLRQDVTRQSGGWMLGVARYQADQLEWFRIFSFAIRPGRSLSRSGLIVREWFEPTDAEADSLMPGSVVVRCSYHDEELEFAMTRSDYTGFATWLESAPPGLPPLTP